MGQGAGAGEASPSPRVAPFLSPNSRPSRPHLGESPPEEEQGTGRGTGRGWEAGEGVGTWKDSRKELK